MSTFTEALARIPFQPRTQNGSGLAAPLLRATSHVITLAALMGEENVDVTPEDINRELGLAHGHIPVRIEAGTTDLSTSFTLAVANYRDLLAIAGADCLSWSEDERHGNIIAIANRGIAVATRIDREALGISDADPGATF